MADPSGVNRVSKSVWVMLGVVAAIMAINLLVVLQVNGRAFTDLESARIGRDAQRLGMGLDALADGLRGYGRTNAYWTDSYEPIRSGDEQAWKAAFAPSDIGPDYGLSGVIGVNADDEITVGGIVSGDSFVAVPRELESAVNTGELVDTTAEEGTGTCSLVRTSLAPYLACGYPSYDSNGESATPGGLVVLKALDTTALRALGDKINLDIKLEQSDNTSGDQQAPVSSSLGTLSTATSAESASTMTLRVALPVVNGAPLVVSADLVREINLKARSVSWVLAALSGGFGLLIFGTLIYLTRREVRDSVAPLEEVLTTVAETGDRSVRVGAHGDGPIERVAHGIDRMLQALSDEEHRANELADQETQREEERRVQELQLAEDERVRAREQVDAAAAKILAELLQVRERADEVQRALTSVSETARRTSSEANTLAERATAGKQSTQALEASLAEVQEVSRLISTVAGQTNMLSLNASIEANRAGEAGRGFAVVANNVKDLAAETTSSTERIDRNIAQLSAVIDGVAATVGGLADGIGSVGGEAAALGEEAMAQLTTVTALLTALDGAAQQIEQMRVASDLVSA